MSKIRVSATIEIPEDAVRGFSRKVGGGGTLTGLRQELQRGVEIWLVNEVADLRRTEAEAILGELEG